MKYEIRELGYYHPSNANWNYYIYLLEWAGYSLRVRSTFGAESRLKQQLIDLGHTVDFSPIGQFEMKYRDIAKLWDIDHNNKELLEKLTRQQTES